MEMTRGDLVSVALPGDYGKPRPALVIQSDFFSEIPSATVLPITSELRDFPALRIDIVPTAENNLRDPSQVMVDKIQSVSKHRIKYTFGHVEKTVMTDVERALALFLGLASLN
jgi:mRNA interferase MazF